MDETTFRKHYDEIAQREGDDARGWTLPPPEVALATFEALTEASNLACIRGSWCDMPDGADLVEMAMLVASRTMSAAAGEPMPANEDRAFVRAEAVERARAED